MFLNKHLFFNKHSHTLNKPTPPTQYKPQYRTLGGGYPPIVSRGYQIFGVQYPTYTLKKNFYKNLIK